MYLVFPTFAARMASEKGRSCAAAKENLRRSSSKFSQRSKRRAAYDFTRGAGNCNRHVAMNGSYPLWTLVTYTESLVSSPIVYKASGELVHGIVGSACMTLLSLKWRKNAGRKQTEERGGTSKWFISGAKPHTKTRGRMAVPNGASSFQRNWWLISYFSWSICLLQWAHLSAALLNCMSQSAALKPLARF